MNKKAHLLKRFRSFRTGTSLEQSEARLAFFMLLPAFTIVAMVILFPVVANFWISFKSVGLGDLRPPSAVVREQVTQMPESVGEELHLTYRMRNSSRTVPIQQVRIEASLPRGLSVVELPPGWAVQEGILQADRGRWEQGFSEDISFRFRAGEDFFTSPVDSRRPTSPEATVRARNPLMSLNFTLDNFRFVITAREFWRTLGVSFFYPFMGALGSILLGILSAQLLNRSFRGQGLLRGLFLFPYVAPVIAVAFAWVFFLDPFSGTVNALALELGAFREPISFLSERSYRFSFLGISLRIPLALVVVILFDSWRYFPFAFLFILARFQAIPDQIYESADVDGAGPFRKFFSITLPQLRSVVATLFLLRFMWTFNKFDDVFLLTGGAAGTRTLPIQVYDNAFGRADIGAGSAASVILFALLALFMAVYFRTLREVDDE
ncbi:carbohydrate ABC transporter membrane protein 1, CUT1 family [Alkalispirochaeta americana]|uniref:Carbohydrate ABC transporter membrane protein 1, CUT1 family n=1 Tax=Alkalispirochaeta americana TaxID=159291 RepID=A0A1N6WM40_9SPIO|nr:sugar ABC transporter permease [Alkalispirochaeta americana]SIQ91115.1 carbohydrate ABC transporter membrane protein 1, CUT1 family [Alkalispirochaeta americana]